MLNFRLARHFPHGLDSDTGGYHFGRVCFCVRSCTGCGGSAAASCIGLGVPGETGSSSADRVFRLNFVFIIVCLDRAVNAATAPPGTMTHHVPGDGERRIE